MKDGGQAVSSMTLLDYFAGKALTAFIWSPDNIYDMSREQVAREVYDYAEAMIEERERRMSE